MFRIGVTASNRQNRISSSELSSTGEAVKSDAARTEEISNDSARTEIHEEALPPLTPLSQSQKNLEEALLAPDTPERAQKPIVPTTPPNAEPANIVPVMHLASPSYQDEQSQMMERLAVCKVRASTSQDCELASILINNGNAWN